MKRKLLIFVWMVFILHNLYSQDICSYVDKASQENRIADTGLSMDMHGRKLYLKTNLAGWALLVSNVAVELDLCRHWSFSFAAYYSGWDYFTQKMKFRTIAILPEFRYWFSDNDGWFVGAHMGMAYFNLAFNDKYRVQDFNRETPALGGGLGGGYRMRLGRSHNWKMEFALGAGAYRVHYDRFRNESNGLMVDSKKRTYVGIDNVSVSLAYMFNLKKRSK